MRGCLYFILDLNPYQIEIMAQNRFLRADSRDFIKLILLGLRKIAQV